MRNRFSKAQADRRAHRAAGVVAILLFASVACGRNASPLAPSAAPDPAGPPPTTTTALAVSGTATSKEDAAPLADVRIEITEGARAGTSVMTDASGRYQMAGLTGGSYTLRATRDGFQPAITTLVLNGDRQLDFQLARSTGGNPAPEAPKPADRWTLSGRVLDATRTTPISGVRIEIVDGANRGRTATTDVQGRYAIETLEAGHFTARAAIAGYTPRSLSVALDADADLEFALVPEAPPTPAGPDVSGRTIDILSGHPVADVTVKIEGGTETTTDGAGAFTAVGASGGTQRIFLSSNATVDRQTQVRVPGDASTLTLIPRALDLRAFDQMVRSRGELHRWVQAPRLVVERRVLAFTNVTDMTYTATAETMTDAEAQALVADLTWALPQLTGQAFSTFASVEIQASAEGAAVSIARHATIVVARFDGLQSAISAWGYGRWAWNGAGEVQMGAIMLDDGFEQSGSPYRRSLRVHELGHALGYDHVASPHSVMHMSGRIEPTAFDADATTIAFRRSPLNRSPDIDPDAVTVNRRTSMRTALQWEGAR